MTWHAVDGEGQELGTGASPVAALSAVPGPAWPLVVVDDDGRRLGFGDALGPGGDRAQDLLDALVTGAAVGAADVEALARTTPAGQVALRLATLDLAGGVEAADQVDPGWLVAVDDVRNRCRRAVAGAGRAGPLEAALHVALLVATDRLDPLDDADVDAHVASGARLWLVAGAIASALRATDPDPFAAWGRLVAAGWWPVGPSRGRLVLSAVR